MALTLAEKIARYEASRTKTNTLGLDLFNADTGEFIGPGETVTDEVTNQNFTNDGGKLVRKAARIISAPKVTPQ